MKISNGMKKLVFVPLLFFASFLFVLYLVVPNYTQSSVLQKRVDQKTQELAEKQAYFSRIKEIADNLTQYQEFLDKIEKALPQEVSLASLLSFFQTKALSSGLIMENISPIQETKQAPQAKTGEGGEGETAEEPEEKIKETRFRLAVTGPFASLNDFLYALEKSSRLIEVESIYFKEGKLGGEEGGPITFDFDLVVKVYSY